VYVIESNKKDKKGKIKESKKLWIDADTYMILKVEFYTGSGRLYRNITCSNLQYVEDILFPMSIDVQDLKSKTDIHITIKDIEINPAFDMDIFIPRDQ
jgi:outer membrane lipoprotein-sorting protein